MEKEIFWMSILSSIIFLFLAIFSIRFFAASVGLALVAILIHRSHEKRSNVDKKSVNRSINRIENLTTKLFNHLNTKTKTLDKEMENASQKIEKVKRDRKNMKGEMNRKLDKMAGKIIKVENKVNESQKRKERSKTDRNQSKRKGNISPFSISDSIEKMVDERGKEK